MIDRGAGSARPGNRIVEWKQRRLTIKVCGSDLVDGTE